MTSVVERLEEKVCSKCHIAQPITAFNKDLSKKDERFSSCRRCRKEYNTKNKEKVAGQWSKYYKENRELCLERDKKYYENNKDKILARVRDYYEANKDNILLHIHEYYETNKEKIIRRNVQYERQRYKTDLNYRIKKRLQGRINQALKNKSKTLRTVQLLGCSVQQFIEHIEKLFKLGMNWDNYGEWHIDHIIPCYVFNLIDINQQKKCFNFKNLQPLWAIENRQKSNKMQGVVL